MTETTFEPIVVAIQKLDVGAGDIVLMVFKGLVGLNGLDEMSERLNGMFPNVKFLLLQAPYEMDVETKILHPTESKHD